SLGTSRRSRRNSGPSDKIRSHHTATTGKTATRSAIRRARGTAKPRSSSALAARTISRRTSRKSKPLKEHGLHWTAEDKAWGKRLRNRFDAQTRGEVEDLLPQIIALEEKKRGPAAGTVAEERERGF